MHAQREPAAIVHHVQHLFAEPAMGGVVGVGQVLGREVDVELFGEVVTGAEVDLRAGIDEGRLGTELRSVLLLAELDIRLQPVEGLLAALRAC